MCLPGYVSQCRTGIHSCTDCTYLTRNIGAILLLADACFEYEFFVNGPNGSRLRSTSTLPRRDISLLSGSVGKCGRSLECSSRGTHPTTERAREMKVAVRASIPSPSKTKRLPGRGHWHAYLPRVSRAERSQWWIRSVTLPKVNLKLPGVDTTRRTSSSKPWRLATRFRNTARAGRRCRHARRNTGYVS